MFSFHGSISNDNNMRLKNSVLQKHSLKQTLSQLNMKEVHQPDPARMMRALRKRKRARIGYLVLLLVVCATVLSLLAVTVI